MTSAALQVQARRRATVAAGPPAARLNWDTVSDCTMFLTADSGAGSSTWIDQSPDHRDLTIMGALSVAGGASGICGAPAWQFNTASLSDYFRGASLADLTDGAEIFLVCDWDLDVRAFQGHWRLGAYADNSFAPYYGTFYESAGSSTSRRAGALPASTPPRIYSVRSFASEFAVAQNGVDLLVETTNTVAWDPDGILLGATGPNLSPAYSCLGRIGALVAYKRKLATLERAIVYAGINARFSRG